MSPKEATPLKGRDRILLDLDDTLYACAPAEAAAAAAVVNEIATALAMTPAAVETAWAAARTAVKQRIDGRGSSHSRLLYAAELVHAVGRPDALAKARSWERTYWRAFLGAATLRPRALAFLRTARAAGAKVAIVSDLTLEVQLLKLETFGVLPLIDALVTSEEVPLDKPASAIFELGMARLGAAVDACVMVGDHDDKDGEGARRLGIPYFKIAKDDVLGDGFDVLAKELGLRAGAPDPVTNQLHELGTALGAPSWVQGPGGNISIKADGVLWVKASGKRLADVAAADGHARVDLGDATRALAGDAGADVRVFAGVPRPSLETYFHALGPAVVAHTHAVSVLLAACATTVPEELGLTVVPYERPGKGLALAVARVRLGEADSQAVLLASHGLLVYAADTAEAIARSNQIAARCCEIFHVSLATFDAQLASYLSAEPVAVLGGFAQALPPRAHGDRYLFPDAVVYASIARVTSSAIDRLPASLAALGRAVVAVDGDHQRVAFAHTRVSLQACVEVLAAHDWVEDILVSRGIASYLDQDEPAKILDLPSEKYRMQLS